MMPFVHSWVEMLKTLLGQIAYKMYIIMSAVLPAQYIQYNTLQHTLESHGYVNDTHLITKLILTA